MTITAVIERLSGQEMRGRSESLPIQAVALAAKTVRPIYEQAIAKIEAASDMPDLSADMSVLLEQCNALSTRIATLHEASKALDIEAHSFAEKQKQIEDELSWLRSVERTKFRMTQKAALEEQIRINKEQDGRHALLLALRKRTQDNFEANWDDRSVENRLEIFEAIERLRAINSGTWGAADPFYIEPVKRIVRTSQGPGNFGTFAAYYMAAAMRWLHAHDNRMAKLARQSEVDQLDVQEKGLAADIANLCGRLASLEEENDGIALKASQLDETLKRLDAAYDRPGFSYDSRLATITAELLVLIPLLTSQSQHFSRALNTRISVDFAPFPGRAVLSGNLTLDQQLAAFRAQLSRVSVLLDRMRMTSVDALNSTPLLPAKEGNVTKLQCELTTSMPRSQIRELLILGPVAHANLPATIKVTGRGGINVEIPSMVIANNGPLDMTLAARGSLLETIDLAAVATITLSGKAPKERTGFMLVSRLVHHQI